MAIPNELYRDRILAGSPAGYWRCGEISGDLLDSSGNGKTAPKTAGTITYLVVGATVSTNTAITLAAVTYCTTTASLAALGTAFTLRAWIKSADWAPIRGIMGQFRSTTPPVASTPYVYSNTAGIGFAWPKADGTGTGSVVTTGTVLSGNVWHYIVCTHDGTTGKIYVNGVLRASAVDTLYSVPAARWYLGAVPNFTFNSSMDEISIQAGAITASDVALEYSLATAIGTVYDDNAITFAADSGLTPARTFETPVTLSFGAASALTQTPSLSTVRAFDLPASAAAAFINSLDAAQSISFPAAAGLSFSATSIIDATLALDAGAGLDPTRGISLEAAASMVVDTALNLTSQGTFNVLVALQAAAAFDTSNTASLNHAFTLLASAAFAASALLSAQSSLTLEAFASLAFIGTGPPLESALAFDAFASADFGLIYRPGGWLEVDPSSGNWTMPPQALSSWTERSAGQANWVKP